MIIEMYRLVRTLQVRGHDIRFLWALGHANIVDNERTNALARATVASSSLHPEAWGQLRYGGGCLAAMVPGAGESTREGCCQRGIGPTRGHDYSL